MTVKIDAKILGIKRPVEVKETGRVMKETLKLQISLGKPKPEDMSFQEFMEDSLKTQEIMEEYVISTLRLTDAQAEKLDDLEGEQLGELIGKITAAVLHFDLSDDEVEEEEVPGKA